MKNLEIDSEINKILSELEKVKYKNFNKTILICNQAIEMCKKADFHIGISLCLYRKGEALSALGKYDESLSILFDSINLSQKNNICDLQIAAQIIIGNILFELGDYEKSFDFYISAKKLATKIASSKNYFSNSCYEIYSAKACTNIAEVYKILGDFENAFVYYKEAEILDKSVNYSSTMGVSLSNLGQINYINGDYDSAEILIKHALKTMAFYEYNVAIAETYGLLASIYDKKGSYDKAKNYFYKAINVDIQYSNKYYKIDALISYSEFLLNRKDTNNALHQLKKAYNIAKCNNLITKSMDICKIVSSVYEKLDDTYNAHKYYKLYFSFENYHNQIIKNQRTDTLKIKNKLSNLEKEKTDILKKSEKLDKTIKNISIISELGQKITSTQDLDSILQILGTTIKTIMNSDSFALALYDENKKLLKYDYCNENNEFMNLPNVLIKSRSSIAAYCLRKNKFIVIDDIKSQFSNYVDNPNYIKDNMHNSWINSAIYSPLVVGNNFVGIMTVQSAKKNAFTAYKIEMMKALSAYAAIAVNNSIKTMNLKSEIDKRKKAQHDLQKLNDTLRFLSENDSLTGIANRRKFDAALEDAWIKAKMYKDALSLIILDIDFFKEYNDAYGHIEGDNCLAMIGKLLTQSLQENYTVARYGGDEFVIILPDSLLKNTIEFGNKLIKKIEHMKIKHSNSKIKNIVTISLGGACVVPNDNISIMQFIKFADDALYTAKLNGRSQIVAKEIAEINNVIIN